MSLNKTLSMIQESMNIYVCPIFLIFGLIGCSFNILLFSQKEFRRISCCLYFLCSSLIMLISLMIGFIPHIYSFDKLISIENLVIVCKLRGYLSQSLAMMYRWLMTMACIDRYMVSSKNILLRKYSNRNVASLIIIIIIIICILFPIHNLIFLNIKNGWCKNSNDLFSLYHSLFTLTLSGFIPISIMILTTILIRLNLVSKQIRRRNSISLKRPKERIRLFNERNDQIVLMLFLQVIIYILSTIPWLIVLLYGTYTYNTKSKSINRIIIERFIRYFCEILVYIYPTLSFYIYTLTSETFRRSLINLIRNNLFVRRDQSILIQENIDLDQIK